MAYAKRMLHLLDTKSTDLAPNSYELPIEVFTSQDIYARERATIFRRAPMFIGLSSELPTAGSYFTRDIVDTPFLALRDRDGQLRLYLNACRHRGMKVALAARGTAARLVCQFHAWSYDLDGRLMGLPEPEAFNDMDRKTRGLIPLPVAEKYGMIFGCASPDVAVDVDEALGGLGAELAEWGFDNYSIYGAPHLHETNGNWKFAWDTFSENYHFSVLHRQTLGDLLHSSRMAFDVFGRNVRVVSAWRTIDEMRKLPESEWEPVRHLSIQYRLYPSVSFTVLPEFMAVYWVLPGSRPSHTQALHVTYMHQQARTGEELQRLDKAIQHGCENVVQKEDFWVTAQSEAGMRAPAAPATFVLGRNEPALQHFHRLYAEEMAT